MTDVANAAQLGARSMMTRLAYVTLLLSALAASGCSKSRPNTGTDGATHFLVSCDANTDCGPLACVCGVCSRSCKDDAQCTGLDDSASCLAASAPSCGGEARGCALECADHDECSAYGARARCQEGRCTRPAPDMGVDGGVVGGNSGRGGSGGRGGAGGSSGSSGTGSTTAGSAASPRVCVRMDANWDGTECLRELGYTWDGATCQLIQCGCDGDDCAALYATQRECEDAHEGCAACRTMDARSDGTKCAASAGYSWNGLSCDEVVCRCTGSDCSAIYPSRSACEDAHRTCPPLTMCTNTTECSLAVKDCCNCRDQTPPNLTAISTAGAEEYEARICDPEPACMQCGGILPVPGRYVPQCVPSSRWEGGECALLDLGALACTQAVGCRVRVRGCCECGADTSLIQNLMAIPNGSDIGSMWCLPGGGCDGCLPIYPDDVTARCGASGFCELVQDGAVVEP